MFLVSCLYYFIPSFPNLGFGLVFTIPHVCNFVQPSIKARLLLLSSFGSICLHLGPLLTLSGNRDTDAHFTFLHVFFFFFLTFSDTLAFNPAPSLSFYVACTTTLPVEHLPHSFFYIIGSHGVPTHAYMDSQWVWSLNRGSHKLTSH